jgi:multidrug efflux pump subunit AcrA (membrane-fusion protein)
MKIVAVLIAVAALIAGGAYALNSRKAQLAAAPRPAPLPAIVEAVTIPAAGVPLTLPALATVSSDQSVTLSTKLTGRVLRVFRREGDRVEKGELLAELDAAEIQAKRAATQQQQTNLDYEIASKQAALEALKVALANSEESHGRTRELLAVKWVSVEQSQTEETQIAALAAQIAVAQQAIAALHAGKRVFDQTLKETDALLGYARVVSPINGTLAVRHVQEGDLALPGKPLFSLTGQHDRYLTLRLPPDLSAREIRWNGSRLPLVPRNAANQNSLAEYRSPVPADARAVEGEQVQVSVVAAPGVGPVIPVDTLLSVNGRDFVLLYEGERVTKQTVTVTHRGVEGVQVREALAGKTLLSAMPDILLRVSSGVPVRVNRTR